MWGSTDIRYEKTLKQRLFPPDPFAVPIFCTSDPEKVDRGTRSKWARCLQFAAMYKSLSKLLEALSHGEGHQCMRGTHNPEHVSKRTAACVYIRVDDADALHAHWRADGIMSTGLVVQYGLQYARICGYRPRWKHDAFWGSDSV